MQISSLNLLDQFQQHIEHIGIMNDRILPTKYDINSNTGELREQVVSSFVNATLTVPNWKKVCSSIHLERQLASLIFSEHILNYLLDYAHENEVTENEWVLLSKHDSKLAEYRDTHGEDIDSEWFLPIALQALKMEGDFVEVMESIQTRFKAHNLPERYRPHLKNHYVTKKILSLVEEKQISYNLFSTLAKIYEEDQEEQKFDQVCELLVSYPNSLLKAHDLDLFYLGLQKVSKHLTNEQMGQLQTKLGDSFADVLVEIGDKVKVELNEKAVNHLFHKEGSAVEVLFHPYGDIVRETMIKVEGRFERSGFRREKDYEGIRKVTKFVQYLAMNKKKAFFRLLENANLELSQIPTYSVLINERFYNLVNVNTLNLEAMLRLKGTKLAPSQFEGMEDQMTFQEFELLNEASRLHADMFPLLNDLKVDHKLRVLAMLPNVDYAAEYLDTYEEFKKILLDSMSDQQFSGYTELMKTYNVSKKGALFIHLYSNRWKTVIADIQSDQDIELLMKYEINGKETLLEMKERLYKDLPLITQFKEFLGASEAFLKVNRNNFYRFYERNLMKAVLSYKGCLDINQINNLRLLCKAEIADKLKDVKFRDEDFAKEIGTTPSYDIREGWKKDFSINNKRFTIEESNDFYDLINFGVIPTHTCQAWDTGSYRHCLLSIFDLNKKIIVVKQGEQVVGRAIIRLTKTKLKKKGNNRLEFVDIEKDLLIDAPSDLDHSDEKIVMFLERFYTTHTGDARKQMIKGVFALAEEKTKDMNIELLYAKTYNADKPYVEEVNLPIYISRSKNGKQYLDSLGGEANEESGGKYYDASVLRLK